MLFPFLDRIVWHVELYRLLPFDIVDAKVVGYLWQEEDPSFHNGYSILMQVHNAFSSPTESSYRDHHLRSNVRQRLLASRQSIWLLLPND